MDKQKRVPKIPEKVQKIRVPRQPKLFKIGDPVEVRYEGLYGQVKVLRTGKIISIDRGGITTDATTSVFGHDGRYPGYNAREPYLVVVK